MILGRKAALEYIDALLAEHVARQLKRLETDLLLMHPDDVDYVDEVLAGIEREWTANAADARRGSEIHRTSRHDPMTGLITGGDTRSRFRVRRDVPRPRVCHALASRCRW